MSARGVCAFMLLCMSVPFLFTPLVYLFLRLYEKIGPTKGIDAFLLGLAISVGCFVVAAVLIDCAGALLKDKPQSKKE